MGAISARRGNYKKNKKNRYKSPRRYLWYTLFKFVICRLISVEAEYFQLTANRLRSAASTLTFNRHRWFRNTEQRISSSVTRFGRERSGARASPYRLAQLPPADHLAVYRTRPGFINRSPMVGRWLGRGQAVEPSNPETS